MVVPKKLFPGAVVGILCTSGSVSADRMEKVLSVMKSDGLIPVAGESCYSEHGYLAGTDKIRAKDINEMFADPEIDAIICAKGGYGSQRLLDMLDFEMIERNPKLFAGYSDVTALHTVFNQRCNFVTYHAPMYATELYGEVDDYTLKSYGDNMYEGGSPSFENPAGLELKTLVPGYAEGILTGGNLSLLASSLGTPYEIDTRGKILFIEDVHEQPYNIDRMMTQLKYSGKFKDCVGIILGTFKNCNPEEPENSLELIDIFNEIIAPEGRPTVYDFACGHSMPSLTLPLGMKFCMDSTRRDIQLDFLGIFNQRLPCS